MRKGILLVSLGTQEGQSVEIAEEYKQEFINAGGEHLQLVESLNGSPIFISELKEMIQAG